IVRSSCPNYYVTLANPAPSVSYGIYRSHSSPTACPGDGGMPRRTFLRKSHWHPFLPREVPFGIGSVVLARIFRLIGHIGTEVGHDLRGKQFHGPHDLLVRDLT